MPQSLEIQNPMNTAQARNYAIYLQQLDRRPVEIPSSKLAMIENSNYLAKNAETEKFIQIVKTFD